ncbi:MAG: hypothetical protein AAB250_14750 [Bdellovibrionota bacterium]
MELENKEKIREGTITRKIEQQTAKLSSINWLALAVASMGLSATTALIFRNRPLGNFFGLWAPSFMLIGVYNKIVKLEADVERSLMH